MVEVSLDNATQLSVSSTFSEASYYRARYYDSNTGRFISEDPAGFDGDGVDFYGYSYNSPTDFVDSFGLSGTGTATAPAPTAPPQPPKAPPKAPPISDPEPPLPTTEPPPSWWPGIGAILGRGLIVGLVELLDPPATARDEDQLPKPKDKTPPCENKNEPDCKKATPFHLAGAGIGDPHAFKRDFLGNKAPVSRFDICACKDGSIIIKPEASAARRDQESLPGIGGNRKSCALKRIFEFLAMRTQFGQLKKRRVFPTQVSSN